MTVAELMTRYKRIKAERDSHFLGLWREARKYFMPEALDYLVEGGICGKHLYDTTSIRARSRLASGMYSWMLDPTKRLIELKAGDPALEDVDSVRQFFAELTKLVIDEIANSNYATVTLQLLNSCACGIDGVIYAGDDHGKLALEFIPIESCCYLTDAKDSVDTIFREISLTSRQIVDLFADGSVPDFIAAEAAKPETADRKHLIIHAVFPRANRDKDAEDNKNFPFADFYILNENQHLLLEGGHQEFPFCVLRFDRVPGESYGRGPGVNMLPDVKMLNRMRLALITGIERANDPSTLLPENSLVDDTWNQAAGAVNIYKVDPSGAKPEYMSVPVRISELWQAIQEERRAIEDGFYLDIFNPLGDMRNMSATEAEIRNEGKLVPFAPIVGNVHNDFLAPFIHRIIGIISRAGKLPPLPDELAATPEYRIEFVSRIALAIKQLESAAWVRVEGTIQGLLNTDPAGWDNFDRDILIRNIARAAGVDPKAIVGEDERDKIRAARAEAQNQQQQTAALGQAAAALPALSKAIEPGSVLAAMQNGM